MSILATSLCIAGDTLQAKSVVRQVYTSRLHPHWQWIWCSRSSRCAAVIDGCAFGFGSSVTGL